MTFCITFGQGHPLRDGWIEIEAVSILEAREKAFATFDRHWSFIYHQEDFVDNQRYFSAGKFGGTLI